MVYERSSNFGGDIEMKWIRTDKQIADIFMKALPKGSFEKFVEALGVMTLQQAENTGVCQVKDIQSFVECESGTSERRVPKAMSPLVEKSGLTKEA